MMELDYLIKNGTIIDGSGNPAFQGNVGIYGEKIVYVGSKCMNSKCVIHGEGLIVAPGFVDVHSHDDLDMLVNPGMSHKILQGITTHACGMCGKSPAPYMELGDQRALPWKTYVQATMCDREVPFTWHHFSEYLDALEAAGPAVNTRALVSHGAIRSCVMGLNDRLPDKEELQDMKELLAGSLNEGAFGFSTGLMYLPMSFSDKHELLELCMVAGEYGRGVYPHMRNYREGFLDSVDEFLDICEKSGASLNLSHLGVRYKKCWPLMEEALSHIKEAQNRGLNVTFDAIFYCESSTAIIYLLPPWANAGGEKALLQRLEDPAVCERIKAEFEATANGPVDVSWDLTKDTTQWDKIVVLGARTKEAEEYVGRSIARIAEEMQSDEMEAVFEVIRKNRGAVFIAMHDIYSYENYKKLLLNGSMIASDGTPIGSMPHRRKYNVMAHMICQYYKADHVISLEKLIRQMTWDGARLLCLDDRGMVKEGMFADLCIFDLERLEEVATDLEPARSPRGICHVFVNGKPAVRDGKLTENRTGKVLRYGGKRKISK